MSAVHTEYAPKPAGFRGRSAKLAAALLLTVMPGSAAYAADVSRLAIAPDTGFPISAAVTVPAGLDTVYLSGALGPVVNAAAPKDSPAAYGDTETQTTGALTRLRDTLARLKLGMGDVVKMTVFLVADPNKGNKMDFAGMMAGYKKFFGTKEQPNKPARSAVQVAALAAPGALVEIEMVAAHAR